MPIYLQEAECNRSKDAFGQNQLKDVSKKRVDDEHQHDGQHLHLIQISHGGAGSQIKAETLLQGLSHPARHRCRHLWRPALNHGCHDLKLR